jgi:hypothetical protein
VDGVVSTASSSRTFEEAIMQRLNRLLVPVVAFAALVSLGVPVDAAPAGRPFDGTASAGSWGPFVPVPIPTRRASIAATAISDRGHIAVAYRVSDGDDFVIVRSPRGVWRAPHRLNPRLTGVNDVELAFDAEGTLTAFWSYVLLSEPMPPRAIRYAVASKPAHRRWTGHVRVGPVQHDGDEVGGRVVLSVAPSGKAVIGWRQYVTPLDEFQFTVRVRRSADAAWGPPRPISAVSNRLVVGDVAIDDHGTATAAWTACALSSATPRCVVQRSRLTRAGTWTTPVTIARNAEDSLRPGHGFRPVEVASTPAGFTAITWIRRHNERWQTVVNLRTVRGVWSRNVVPGLHDVGGDTLAVGPNGTVVMVRNTIPEGGGIAPLGVRITWRTNRSNWTTTTLAPTRKVAWALAPAVDSTGRIFVPWSEFRGRYSGQNKGLITTHLNGWRTTELWNWRPTTDFAAAAVSWNGRAVAIRETATAVQMRVLRPR